MHNNVSAWWGPIFFYYFYYSDKDISSPRQEVALCKIASALWSTNEHGKGSWWERQGCSQSWRRQWNVAHFLSGSRKSNQHVYWQPKRDRTTHITACWLQIPSSGDRNVEAEPRMERRSFPPDFVFLKLQSKHQNVEKTCVLVTDR